MSRFSERKADDLPYFSNSRLYYLIAIIFLLFFLLVYQLYSVQIVNRDKYLARADQQHNMHDEIKAKRGSIYLRTGNGDLRPLALNKEYASIYINPRALSRDDIWIVLDAVFDVFYRESVESRVDEILRKEEKKELENELKYIDILDLSEEEKKTKKEEAVLRHEKLKINPEWIEFREIKRELEIEERKQNILNPYFSRLNFPERYSRLIKRKVEKESLLELYFLLLKDDFEIFSSEDLYLEKGSIFLSDGRNISNEIWGFHYEWEDLRYYPEPYLFSGVLGFSNIDNIGHYGLEGFFDHELKGKDGFLIGDRGIYHGERIVINKREYQAPVDGQSLVLTIDYAVQMNVCQKLKEAYERYKFDSGNIIVMDPQSGKIIAMCLWPSYDLNNYNEVEDPSLLDNSAVSHQYEPGSVFKTITLAMAMDQGKIDLDTHYQDRGEINITGWPRAIRNSDFSSRGGHGWVDMNYVLKNSLNTGSIFAAFRLGSEHFADYLKRFGFGERSGIELSSESPGDIRKFLASNVKEIDLATASYGQGIAVTPLQMISSYASIANDGKLMKPYIVEEILDSEGNTVKKIEPREIRQVISEQTARTISAMLVNVVEDGHANLAQIDGYYIGAKTGTAQAPSPDGGYFTDKHIHNVVGSGPIEDPKFTILIMFDNPKVSAFAAGTVIPFFGEISDFLLKYYQIPKGRR
jgi:cell division protein FtsI/penicillin-binding protein 2